MSKEPNAEFKELGTHFRVVFPRKDVENVPENVPEKRQEAILGMLAKNSRTPIPELAKVLHLNEKTIKKDIEKLKVSKRLRRVGPDKGGRWEIL